MSSTKASSRVLNELAKGLPADRTRRNEPLALHTYIKLGGVADMFTVAKSADELTEAVIAAEKLRVPWFILGGGSNILVGDLGFRGLVIKNEAEKLVARGSWLVAESGVLMSKLAAFANEKGLAGLEMFMSVPGTVGGAIYNNSHFRPDENEFIGNLVEEAEIMIVGDSGIIFSGDARQRDSNPEVGILKTRSLKVRPIREFGLKTPSSPSAFSFSRKVVSREWFRFGYDYSRLQEERAVVLRVKFRLKRELPSVLRERSLEMMKRRNRHQPIGRPSCGCMFKNLDGVSARLAARQAGKLIDEAGLKGTGVGGMSVSDTHANFMVNDGTAKVGDVLELMARVKKRVKEKFGVELEPEIFMVGEFSKCLNL